jgi:hypothetical protein
MARGWESKSVEAQMEESRSAKRSVNNPALTEEQTQFLIKKKDLMLSRSRVVQQLEHSTNERYSELMRQTLAELDKQIEELSS